MRNIFFLLFVIIVFTSSLKSKGRVYHFTPDTVVLSGVLIEKMFYGPPGYGEHPKTDSKEYPFILKLSSPISVVAHPNDSINQTRINVKEIQTINFVHIKLIDFLGKRIKVIGTLSSALIGHDHTDVLIKIITVNEIKNK